MRSVSPGAHKRSSRVLPRRLLAVIPLLVASAIATPAESDSKPSSVLEGTWLVIAHYKDESTANPEALRWLDEVWVFQMKGSRLYWTKYPIVVFDDTTGRFETLGSNPRSRVLAAWEPNPAQREELLAGPKVNSRGSKLKTLRGSDEKGWRTSSRMQVRSATTIGYQEDWSVEGLPDKPVFERRDTMGSGMRQNVEGGVVYAVTEWGEIPRGTYERDGIRHGTFLMMRTPEVRSAAPTEGTPNERAAERATQRYLEELQKRGDEQP